MPRFIRKSKELALKKVIRIYTEGTKTEPNYFGAIRDELRLPEIHIDIQGTSRSTMSLVDYVICEKESDKEDTEWWVVFDRDDHEHFNASIEKARANGIQVAYSNECFELWFVLHFEFLQSSIGRDNFPAKLSKLIGQKYGKNTNIYELIKDKEATAIRNAKRLDVEYDRANIDQPLARDPSTTVCQLVEALRKLK